MMPDMFNPLEYEPWGQKARLDIKRRDKKNGEEERVKKWRKSFGSEVLNKKDGEKRGDDYRDKKNVSIFCLIKTDWNLIHLTHRETNE